MSGRRGRKEFGRGFLPGAVTLLALVLMLGAASAAQARVALVATGTPELAFLGIPRNEVVARLALPGPARAVAVSPTARAATSRAGGEIVAVDVNTRLDRPQRARRRSRPRSATSSSRRGGETLYAVRGPQLLVLDAQTLAQRALVELRGEGVQLAVANNGRAAAVTLTSGRVAMVALGTNALLRRVKLKGATGVAIADNGVTYVTAREPAARHRARTAPRAQEGDQAARRRGRGADAVAGPRAARGGRGARWRVGGDRRPASDSRCGASSPAAAPAAPPGIPPPAGSSWRTAAQRRSRS